MRGAERWKMGKNASEHDACRAKEERYGRKHKQIIASAMRVTLHTDGTKALAVAFRAGVGDTTVDAEADAEEKPADAAAPIGVKGAALTAATSVEVGAAATGAIDTPLEAEAEADTAATAAAGAKDGIKAGADMDGENGLKVKAGASARSVGLLAAAVAAPAAAESALDDMFRVAMREGVRNACFLEKKEKARRERWERMRLIDQWDGRSDAIGSGKKNGGQRENAR